MMGLDPRLMLAQQSHRPGLRLPNPLVLLLVALVLAEAFAPDLFKPSYLAGRGAANFYGEIMDEDNRKQLDYDEQQEPARTRATREMEYQAWKGRCSALGTFDPDAGSACMTAANEFYRHTLPPARNYRQNYSGG